MWDKKKKTGEIKLNRRQRKAVKLPEGICCVIAGAGAGKTSVLTQRIIYLVNKFHILPWRLLAITFTKKATAELKERVQKYSGFNEKSWSWIRTIHGFCHKVLWEENDNLLIHKKLLPTQLENELLDEICDSRMIDYFSFDKTLFDHINFIKKINGVVSSEMYQNIFNHFGIKNVDQEKFVEMEEVVEIFQQKIEKENYCQHDDVLIRVYQLLHDNEKFRRKWQNKFDHVLVDEFQDVDLIQYEIISMLVEQKQHLFVVGDSDQSIYSWRGAIANIEKKFKCDFPKARQVILNQNYRCSKNILNVSNALIKNNYGRIEKKLVSKIVYKEPAVYFHAPTKAAEAEWICKKIRELLSKNKSLKYSDIAIIYRDKYCADLIEKQLVKHGLVYYVFGRKNFYAKKIVVEIINYIKAVVLNDENSIINLLTSSPYNIANTLIKKIADVAQQCNISLLDGLSYYCINPNSSNQPAILAFVQALDKLESICDADLVSVLDIWNDAIHPKDKFCWIRTKESEEFNLLKETLETFQQNHPGKTIIDFLHSIEPLLTLQKNDEKNGEEDDEDKTELGNVIRLMTIYLSKGLEFSCVFVSGLVDNVMPNWRTINRINDTSTMVPNSQHCRVLDEERRLLYVAITRAKRYLFLTSYGGVNERTKKVINPSLYINEIIDAGIDRVTK